MVVSVLLIVMVSDNSLAPTLYECNFSVGLGCIGPRFEVLQTPYQRPLSTFVNFHDVLFEFYFIQCRLFGPFTNLNVCILCHVAVCC